MRSLNKSVVTLTNSAAAKLSNMMRLARKINEDRDGVIISTRQRGCNGHSYKMDYTTRFQSKDLMERIDVKGVTLFIDNKSLMRLIGCEVDYVDSSLYSGFVFNNPNAKGSCGCGESFNT